MSKLSICCATLLSLALSGCMTGGEKPPGDKPETTARGDDGGEPEVETPPAKPKAKVSVASVQMIQDCPDTEVEAPPSEGGSASQEKSASMPAPGAVAKRRSADVAEGDSFRQPCDQSTMQLAFEALGDQPVSVEIKAIRIMSDCKSVGEVASRKPKIFVDSVYQAWDQRVTPGGPVQASYKLAMPAWDKVETAIGKSSFGHMFTLEIDVAVDGTIMTVSSPQFPRDEPHVIVT
jgi:hypothetical protein